MVPVCLDPGGAELGPAGVDLWAGVEAVGGHQFGAQVHIKGDAVDVGVAGCDAGGGAVEAGGLTARDPTGGLRQEREMGQGRQAGQADVARVEAGGQGVDQSLGLADPCGPAGAGGDIVDAKAHDDRIKVLIGEACEAFESGDGCGPGFGLELVGDGEVILQVVQQLAQQRIIEVGDADASGRTVAQHKQPEGRADAYGALARAGRLREPAGGAGGIERLPDDHGGQKDAGGEINSECGHGYNRLRTGK